MREASPGRRFVSWFVGFLSVLWLTGLPVAGDASGEAILDAEAQFRYAEARLAAGAFAQAAAEFERFVHFFPGDPRVGTAMYHQGLAYYSVQDYDTAVDTFRRLLDRDDAVDFRFSAYYMTSQSYLAQRKTGAAVTTLHNLSMVSARQQEKDAAFHELGWIYLLRMWPDDTNGSRQAFDTARNFFQKVSPAQRAIFQLDTLDSRLDGAGQLPRKVPWVAGALSVVPGGGQLYNERYFDAASALLVNVALGWAAYESFDNELYALGGVITAVGLGFYAGNIYGAVSGAHKFNRDKRQAYARLLDETVRIRFAVPSKGDRRIVVGVEGTF